MAKVLQGGIGGVVAVCTLVSPTITNAQAASGEVTGSWRRFFYEADTNSTLRLVEELFTVQRDSTWTIQHKVDGVKFSVERATRYWFPLSIPGMPHLKQGMWSRTGDTLTLFPAMDQHW